MIEDSQVDTRDLRDPTAVGEALLEFAGRDGAYPNVHPLSTLADSLDRGGILHRGKPIPDYAHDSSTVDETVAAYRKKMQEQAAQGDLASVRTLLDKGWPLPEHLDQAILERAQEMQSVSGEVLDT